MNVDVFKISYKSLYRRLNDAEIAFITGCLAQDETGSYYVCEQTLYEAEKKAQEQSITVPEEMLAEFRKELQDPDDSFDIQVF